MIWLFSSQRNYLLKFVSVKNQCKHYFYKLLIKILFSETNAQPQDKSKLLLLWLLLRDHLWDHSRSPSVICILIGYRFYATCTS